MNETSLDPATNPGDDAPLDDAPLEKEALDDAALDDLLRLTGAEPTPAAVTTARAMAREAAAPNAVTAGRPAPSRRRSRTAVGLVACTLALAAAGTMTAYQLRVPPFQGLHDGEMRTSTGAPITWTTNLGTRVECLVFLNFTGVNATQHDQLDATTTSPFWQGFGQRTYAQLPPRAQASQIGPGEVGDAAAGELLRRALVAAPGVAGPSSIATTGPRITGTSTSCTYPQGIRSAAPAAATPTATPGR